MCKKICFVIATIIFFSISVFATEDSLSIEMTDEQYYMIYQAYLDSIESGFNYELGEIEIGEGVATISVPTGFKFLNGEDSDMVLTELWGNPPSEEGNKSIGMLIPASQSIMSDSTFVVNITYSKDGYIKDSDAFKIDYDELLSTMKDEIKEENKMREENGYETYELLGWASPPFYDMDTRKLHWAKELHFTGYENNTLNYSIRVLGRKGFLELNAIGEMYIIDEVKNNIDPILESVNFNEGFRYSEFDPKIDKVAAYGIGALIAGKVLAKAGILAKLGIFLLKFWKIAVLAIVGLLAGLRKFFSNKKSNEDSDAPKDSDKTEEEPT